MADSATVNHNLVLPEVGASKDSWGTKINQNLTKLDTLLKVGLGTFVNRAGDTMTGMLTLPTTNPTAGTHAAHKSYVDTQISTNVANLNAALVPKTRTLTGGVGITTVIGDLSADRTISVDDTVVRTVSDQLIGGNKTFSSPVTIETGATSARLAMPSPSGPKKELNYTGAVLGFYDRTNLRWDLQIDAAGNLIPRGTMDAVNLSGTIDTARLPSDVVKTTGDQTIGSTKTFQGALITLAGNAYIRRGSADQKAIWFQDSDANNRAIIYVPGGSADLRLASYNSSSTFGSRLEIRESGDIIAVTGRFAGSGSGLTNLPAGSLTGTINNARLSGDYSFANLDLSGRLLVSGSDNWGSLAGVRIDGTTPNIYFRQTDATANGMIGVNSSSFYILGDMNGDGTFDSTAFQLALDGSSLRIGGALMAEAGRSISAGSGLTGGGDLTASRTLALGTPSSITGTSGNTLTTTSHTHSLDLGNLPIRAASSDPEPRLLYINGTDSGTLSRIAASELHAAFGVVPSGRYVSAGAGLSGGGDFTANRSIAMGTPSSITATSTNSTTSTSHTHALSNVAIRELLTEGTAGQIGTYGLLERQGSITMEPNETSAGSNLKWSTADGWVGATPSGTWRLMGRIETGAGDANNVSLWLRIS